MAEQDDELWDTGRVAAYLGVQPVTVSAYLHRQQMPAPDYRFGQSPVWKASKIKAWHESRPGRRSEPDRP
ncbi:MAG: helix-turn-helix transcriptional regulator [Acidimicrobiales bacterium]